MRYIEKEIQNLLIQNLANNSELLPLANLHLSKLQKNQNQTAFLNSSAIDVSTLSTTSFNSLNLVLISSSESLEE